MRDSNRKHVITKNYLGVGLDVLGEDDEGHEAAALVIGRHHRLAADLQRGVARFGVLAWRRPVDLFFKRGRLNFRRLSKR